MAPYIRPLTIEEADPASAALIEQWRGALFVRASKGRPTSSSRGCSLTSLQC